MKKMLVCCGVLCMALLLFCGTALAKVEINAVDSAVTVAQKSTDKAIFTVTKSDGVESGQLYLVMIQQGDDTAAAPKPTKENLYYLNVETAESAPFSVDAYPKDMGDGSYVVYLSDYADSGAAKGVATLVVSGGSVDDVAYGDVNGDGNITGADRIILARYLAKLEGYGPDGADTSHLVILANSDLNGDGNVNGADRIILARHLAKLDGYQTLPIPKS